LNEKSVSPPNDRGATWNWFDFRDTLRKYLFEYDRISHLRLQFSIALQTAIVLGGGAVLSQGKGHYVTLTVGISAFGLFLLLISWGAIWNLDNRIWHLHSLLLGKVPKWEDAKCDLHILYLEGGPSGHTGKMWGRRLLVRVMPALFFVAYVGLCVFALCV
jgi:hypothetical protein